MKLYFGAFVFIFFSCNQNHTKNEKILILNDSASSSSIYTKIAELDSAILADPSNAKLYNNRGTYFSSVSEFRKAEKDYIKSLDLNSNDPYTWDNYGTLKVDQNDLKAAIASYKKAVELSPKNSQFINNLGWALLNNKSYFESIKYFDRAIDLDSGSCQAYANRGLALIGLKQNENGCLSLQKALSKGCSEAKKYVSEYCH